MARLRTIKYENNTGGLNKRASEMALKPHESPDLLNVKLTKYGAIVKENGYVLYNTNQIAGAPEIGGLYDYVKSTTKQQFLVMAAGPHLYKANNCVFEQITRTSGAYDTNKIWDFATINDICIAVNGSDLPQKYDGNAFADDLNGNPPTGPAFVEVFKNRVFLAGDETNPTKLSYSALANPEDWHTIDDAGWVEVGLNDGQKITALKAFFDVLLIFKEHSIYALTGSSGDPTSDDYFYLRPVNSSIGAASNRSIVQVGNDLFFLSYSGIYGLRGVQSFGDLNVINISFKIQPLIDGLNKANLAKSFAINDIEEGRIWFFVSTGSSTKNDQVLIYDYVLDAWTRRSGFSVNCGILYKDAAAATERMLTGAYNGFIYHQKQGYSYAGQPIQAYYTTPWLDLSNYRCRKKVRDIQFITAPTGSYNLNVKYRWDFGSNFYGNLAVDLSGDGALWGQNESDTGTAIWDLSSWDSVPAIKTTKTINGSGNALQLTFWNSSADEYFILLGWYINLIERGIR